MTEIEQLLARVGRYAGHGIDHEDQPFHGEFVLEPILGGRGLSLTFRAEGIDGALYHDERSWIAHDSNGVICLWSLHTNAPGVVQHRLRHGAPVSGTLATLVFGAGDPADTASLRVEVAFDLWPDGDVGYRFAWGMPGGIFMPRSSVRMSLED